MKQINFLLWFILLCPLALAVSTNNTLIQSIGLNTNITVNSTIFYDKLVITSDGIYFENYTAKTNNSLTSERISFNVTVSNKNFSVNSTRNDLPYFSSSTSTSNVLSSNLSSSINATVVINSPSCYHINGGLDSLSINRPDGTSLSYGRDQLSCSNGQVTFSNMEIQPGNTSISIQTFTDSNILGKFIIICVIGFILIAILVGIGNPILMWSAIYIIAILAVILILQLVVLLLQG